MPAINDFFIEIVSAFFQEEVSAIDDQDCTIQLVQTCDNKQIVLMQFKRDIISQEFHINNCSQWGFVLAGEMSLQLPDEKLRILRKGDVFSIPKNTPHCVNIKQGYQDVTIFNGQRYNP